MHSGTKGRESEKAYGEPKQETKPQQSHSKKTTTNIPQQKNYYLPFILIELARFRTPKLWVKRKIAHLWAVIVVSIDRRGSPSVGWLAGGEIVDRQARACDDNLPKLAVSC